MTDLKMLSTQAALVKLFDQSYFSVCTIDRITEMMGIKPDREAYQILRTLHCVDYNQMPPALLQALPDLIMRVMQSPALDASRINIVSEGSSLKLVKH